VKPIENVRGSREFGSYKILGPTGADGMVLLGLTLMPKSPKNDTSLRNDISHRIFDGSQNT
jgi:hypothetical protein